LNFIEYQSLKSKFDEAFSDSSEEEEPDSRKNMGDYSNHDILSLFSNESKNKRLSANEKKIENTEDIESPEPNKIEFPGKDAIEIFENLYENEKEKSNNTIKFDFYPLNEENASIFSTNYETQFTKKNTNFPRSKFNKIYLI